jgi:CRP/FNR family transcriptional regulator, cyclic AMP receptor protein
LLLSDQEDRCPITTIINQRQWTLHRLCSVSQGTTGLTTLLDNVDVIRKALRVAGVQLREDSDKPGRTASDGMVSPQFGSEETWENEMSCNDAPKDDIATGELKMPFDPRIFLSKAANERAFSHYRANELVYSQGDPADSIFYIQDGMTKVTVFSERGKEAIIGLPGAGDFFGEGCLVGQELRQATVSTRTKCVIVRLPKAHVIGIIRDKPAFAELFISHLVARNIRIEEDLLDHLFNTSEKRLARVLLSLTNFDEEGRPKSIPIKVSQEMLAEMVGTTRARVSFFMNKFRKLGFIDYKGHIEVHNSLFSVILNDNSETQTIGGKSHLSLRASTTGQLNGRQGGAHLRQHRDVKVTRIADTRRAGG